MRFCLVMDPNGLQNCLHLGQALLYIHFFTPPAQRGGGVLSSRSGRAGGQAAARLAEPISL